MEMIKKYFISIILLVIISGCQTTGEVKKIHYPAELSGIGDSPNYPLSAAGFKRAKIITYTSDMTNLSFAYNYFTTNTQITATIYTYKNNATKLKQQFYNEKNEISKFHPNAKFLNESKIIFKKHGKNISALKASYEINSVFMNSPQIVYSELYLIKYGENFIKLRSSGPISQKNKASKMNIELMNAVDWAN